MLRRGNRNLAPPRTRHSTRSGEELLRGRRIDVDDVDSPQRGPGVEVIRVARRAVQRLVAGDLEKADQLVVRAGLGDQVEIERRPGQTIGGQSDAADQRPVEAPPVQELF